MFHQRDIQAIFQLSYQCNFPPVPFIPSSFETMGWLLLNYHSGNILVDIDYTLLTKYLLSFIIARTLQLMTLPSETHFRLVGPMLTLFNISVYGYADIKAPKSPLAFFGTKRTTKSYVSSFPILQGTKRGKHTFFRHISYHMTGAVIHVISWEHFASSVLLTYIWKHLCATDVTFQLSILFLCETLNTPTSSN